MTRTDRAGEADLNRPHLWRAGTGGPPLVLLHGTGGDERSLLPVADRLAPGAPVLSPRGTVLENGTELRYFRRLAPGVIDEDDLRSRTDDIAAFLSAAGARYGVRAGAWVPVGFSNGANLATALLLRHPAQVAGAVLVAAMPPFAQPPTEVDLSGRRIAVVYGLHDRITHPTRSRDLATDLRRLGATVVELAHKGGHAVPDAVVPELRTFLAGFAEPPGWSGGDDQEAAHDGRRDPDPAR